MGPDMTLILGPCYQWSFHVTQNQRKQEDFIRFHSISPIQRFFLAPDFLRGRKSILCWCFSQFDRGKTNQKCLGCEGRS